MDEFSDLQSNKPLPEQYPHYGYKPPRSNSFMLLSLSFGILSITCCSVIFISMIACGLSILFALLSRGNDQKLNGLCKAGIATSVFGLICSVGVTASACYMMFYDTEYRQQLNEACEQIYGITFDDMLEEAYPELNEMINQDANE